MTPAAEHELVDLVREIRDRVSRTETRIVVLGDHVGADLRSSKRVTIKMHPRTAEPWVDLTSMDVSLSGIINELASTGEFLGDVCVMHKGVHVATIHLKP